MKEIWKTRCAFANIKHERLKMEQTINIKMTSVFFKQSRQHITINGREKRGSLFIFSLSFPITEVFYITPAPKELSRDGYQPVKWNSYWFDATGQLVVVVITAGRHNRSLASRRNVNIIFKLLILLIKRNSQRLYWTGRS
jgi:hypothetical protein